MIKCERVELWLRRFSICCLRLLGVLLLLLAMAGARVALAVTTDLNVKISADDGIMLHGDLILPDGATFGDGQKFPAVVMVNPWTIPAEGYLLKANEFAQHGYIVLAVACRGMAGSGGTTGIGDAKDVADMRAWVDWLIGNTAVDPAKIGMTGVSYGAAVIMLAAAHDERIKAVAFMSGWIDFQQTFYGQGTFPQAWGTLLVTMGKIVGHLSDYAKGIVDKLRSYTISAEELAEVTHERSPNDYIDEFNRRQLPIFIQNNLDDHLMWLNHAIDFYKRLTGPKRMYVNVGEHGTSDALGALGLDNGVWQRALQWFDVYLKGEPRPILNEPRIRVPIHNSDREVALADWSNLRGLPHTFSLKPAEIGERFGQLPKSLVESTDTCDLTLTSGKYFNVAPPLAIVGPGVEAHIRVPYYKRISYMDPDKVALFTTPPLAEDKIIFDAPELDLWVTPSVAKAQIIAYLYRVTPDNRAHPISHGPITLHNPRTDAPQQATIKMLFTSFLIPKGDRLMLAVGTYDPYYLNPNSEKYQVKLHFGAEFRPQLRVSFLSL